MSVPPLSAPRVEGVRAVFYLGKSFDLNAVGVLRGEYWPGMYGPTHDVYDVPATAFHELPRSLIPDAVASSPDGSVLRLYVPRGDRGRISDIALVNGVYACPGRPFVPRDGSAIFVAPSDPPELRARFGARPPRSQQGGYRIDDGWEPGPGDRFRVNEVT